MDTYRSLPMAERLALCSRPDSKGCVLWIRGKEADGYGIIHDGKKSRRVHRVAWEVANGPIPVGLHVLHKCDVRACINPDHMFLGTNDDNVKDRNAKGRQVRGERQVHAKLTAEIVRAIRANKRSSRKIAAQYGIHSSTVQYVKRRATWAHVI